MTLAVQIRDAGAADLEAMWALDVRAQTFPWSPNNYATSLRVGHRLRLALAGPRPAGLCVASCAADEVSLLQLAVEPALGRQGVASALLDDLIAWAGPLLGASAIHLEVRDSNRAAIALYEKVGFFEVGRRRGYYPGKSGAEDALLMMLPVAHPALS